MNYRIKNVIYTDRIRRKNVIHIDKMTGKSVDIIEKTAYMTFFNNQRMKKVFDEIQEAPWALEALKYFCENAPEYAVRTSMSNYKEQNWLINLNLYAICNL